MMTREDLSKMDDQKLVHTELQIERDLVSASFRHKTNQLDDTTVPGKLRKDIARLRQEQRAREIQKGLGKNALRDAHRSSFKPASSDAVTAKAGGFLKGIVDKAGATE